MISACRCCYAGRRQRDLLPSPCASALLLVTLLALAGCEQLPFSRQVELTWAPLKSLSAVEARTPYQQMLTEYVGEDGRVDFAALATDEAAQQALDGYLAWAASVEPNQIAPMAARRAFYINAHNASALRAVLAFGPIERLSDCPVDFEKGLQFNVARQWVSLAQLATWAGSPGPDQTSDEPQQQEQAVLAGFALALPIESGPMPTQYLYEPNQLDEQLQAALERYLGSCAGLQIDYATRTVLFGPLVMARRRFFEQWYARRFGLQHVSLLAVMSPWATPPTQGLLADAAGFAVAPLDRNDRLRAAAQNKASDDQADDTWPDDDRLCGRQ